MKELARFDYFYTLPKLCELVRIWFEICASLDLVA